MVVLERDSSQSITKICVDSLCSLLEQSPRNSNILRSLTKHKIDKEMFSIHSRFFPSVLFFLIIGTQLCAALYPVELIYQFPNGAFLENLAVREAGSIVVTLVTSPEVYLIQPSAKHPNPRLIHTFEGSTSVSGIAEVAPDSFVVAVTSVSGPGQAIPGAGSLWRIDFKRPDSDKAKVTLVTKLPDVGTPNGVAKLNKDKVLLADSSKGVVNVIDIKQGTVAVSITDPLLATRSDRPGIPGVNGIKISSDILYFTNSAQNLLGRLPLNSKTGTARGPATKIVNGLPPSVGYDDFALSDNGIAFLTNAAGNFIERVNVRTLEQTIVAGEIDSTEFAEPTAAAFGRNGKENILFVTTGGGLFFPVNGNETVGAQLNAVRLGKKY